MQISSYKNELWGVNSAHETFTTILDENENVAWKLIPGSFIWISVGPTETWAIHPNKTTKICSNPCTGEWKLIAAYLDILSVGNEEVWGVNYLGKIWKSPVPFGGWTYVPGKKATSISVGKYYIYGVSNSIAPFRCANPCNGTWEDLPGSLVQISATLEDDSVFGINTDQEVQKWNGISWEKIGEIGLTNIGAMNEKTILGCTEEGEIKLGHLK